MTNWREFTSLNDQKIAWVEMKLIFTSVDTLTSKPRHNRISDNPQVTIKTLQQRPVWGGK